MKIVIESIPHSQQRYDTCGDYYRRGNEPLGTLNILVSELPDHREMILVAIHELIEAVLCDAAGISFNEIDRFDMAFVPNEECSEPGADPAAPYYSQHLLATAIEIVLAAELGVDWSTYARHIQELSK